jgi:chaperone BCS1
MEDHAAIPTGQVIPTDPVNILTDISTKSYSELFYDGKLWLVDEFANNDFLVGLIVPLMLGWIVYINRGVFSTIVKYIKMSTTSEVTFNSDNNYYHDITEYLYKHSVSKMFQRFFILTYSWSSNSMQLTVGYGHSFGFIGGWPVIINRRIEDSQAGRFKEIVNITIIGGRTKVIKVLTDATTEIVTRDNDADVIRIYQVDKDGDPIKVATKPYRSLDTVIIPQGDKDYIIDKLQEFMNSEESYNRKGLPWHIGLILSGPPGTGKTSLIHAIASHFKRNIYFHKGGAIDTGGMNMSDSILVIEDIDANGMSVQSRETNVDGPDDELINILSNNSMANVLNVLDGLLSPHGLITIATTNHYNSLDPAIVRPGRFDVHLEFKNMEFPEWGGLCTLLERAPPIKENDYVVISPSQARYILLYYTDEEIVTYFQKEKNTL